MTFGKYFLAMKHLMSRELDFSGKNIPLLNMFFKHESKTNFGTIFFGIKLMSNSEGF